MINNLFVGKYVNNGRGVFTKYPFHKIFDLFLFSDKVIEIQHKAGCHCETCCRCIQIGEVDWFCPKENSFGWYLNHSCTPNAFALENEIIAFRQIEEGEEITIDYSTTTSDKFWHMDCACKSDKCRKVVKSVQFLPENLFKIYKGHLLKYMESSYKK